MAFESITKERIEMKFVVAFICFLLAIASMWASAWGVEHFSGTVFALTSLVTGIAAFLFFAIAGLGIVCFGHDEACP